MCFFCFGFLTEAAATKGLLFIYKISPGVTGIVPLHSRFSKSIDPLIPSMPEIDPNLFSKLKSKSVLVLLLYPTPD
jgi:hypothetical protein